MKILQLIDTLNPGGAERMCINISNTLCKSGFEVYICSTRAEGSLKKEIDPGVSYYCLNKRSSADLRAFLKLLKLIKSEKIDLIHAHSTSVFWAVAAKAARRNTKIIWHDHLGSRINNSKINRKYKAVSGQIDAIITVNSELRQWSVSHMNVSQDRIVYINNFALIKDVIKKPGGDYFSIVCVANILPVKSQDLLIRALEIINKNELPKPVKVTFAGYYQENEYFRYLNKLIEKHNLASQIQFAGKIEDISDFLSGADCGVLCSSSEGLPVSLLEYGMAGLPVVVTNVGQCASVLDGGRYGKIVSPGDADGMANELLWIIKNKETAQKMGESFKDHINKNYGHENFLSDYVYLLNTIFKND